MDIEGNNTTIDVVSPVVGNNTMDVVVSPVVGNNTMDVVVSPVVDNDKPADDTTQTDEGHGTPQKPQTHEDVNNGHGNDHATPQINNPGGHPDDSKHSTDGDSTDGDSTDGDSTDGDFTDGGHREVIQTSVQSGPGSGSESSSAAEIWLKDDQREGTLFTNAMIRLSDMSISDAAANVYINLVTQIGGFTIDLEELPMERWVRNTWPKLPSGRKMLILGLWKLVVNGLIDENSQAVAENMDRGFDHVFEIIDYIHIRLVKIEPRDEQVIQWFEGFTKKTNDVVDGIKRDPSRYSLGVAWNLLAVERANCSKDNMPKCRITHMQILRILRRRIEHALTYDCKTPIRVLHENLDKHLFNSADYQKLRGAIVAFAALTPDAKIMHACLIQKRFELMAMINMHSRMVEMMADANAIFASIKISQNISKENVGHYAQIIDRCLNAVDNIEWAAQATWQFNSRFNAYEERMKWMDATKTESTSTESINNNPVTPVNNKEPNQVGGDGDNALVTQDIRTASSNIQRAILSARASVRQTYWNMRRSFMNVLSFPMIKVSRHIVLFLTLSIQPRIQDVLDDMHQRLKRYMKIPYDNDRLVHGAERIQERHLQILSEPTVSETIGFRIKDLASQIIYCLKVIRFAGQLIALRAASVSYMEAFNAAVISRGDPPPPLSQMLFVFLGIDASIQLAVLLAIVLLAYGLPVPSSLIVDREKASQVDQATLRMKRGEIDTAFVIDNDFIAAFLADYFMSTAALAAVGLLMGHLFHSKKYFDLESQGSTTVNAFMVVLTGACATIGAVPFFLMV